MQKNIDEPERCNSIVSRPQKLNTIINRHETILVDISGDYKKKRELQVTKSALKNTKHWIVGHIYLGKKQILTGINFPVSSAVDSAVYTELTI